jgi:hypothetical protein
MQTLRPHPAQLHQTLLSDDSYTCKLTQNFKVKDTKKFFSVRKVRVAKKKKILLSLRYQKSTIRPY